MTLDDIRPGIDERGVLLGQTGCGKTTLAIALLGPYPYVVAVDPKCDLGVDRERGRTHLPGYTLISDPRQLGRSEARKIQYRPDPQFQTDDWYNSVYYWVYERGRTFVYTDDLNLILEGRDPPDGFRACVTCGRSRDIGMLHATQRPAGIPQMCVSESKHVYAFTLQNEYDRKACVSAGVDEIIRSKPILEPFEFYYKGPRVKGTRHLHLNLGGRLRDRT